MVSSNYEEMRDIHDFVFKDLYSKYLNDSNFQFTVRQRNNKERLDKGYWFVGNEDRYLTTSFWSGRDWKNKTPYINLVFFPSDSTDRKKYNVNDCCISLVCKGNEELKIFYKEIFKRIDGFEEDGLNRWICPIDSEGYIDGINKFIAKYKPVIDECIKEYQPHDLGFLDERNRLYINRIVDRKENQI